MTEAEKFERIELPGTKKILNIGGDVYTISDKRISLINNLEVKPIIDSEANLGWFKDESNLYVVVGADSRRKIVAINSSKILWDYNLESLLEKYDSRFLESDGRYFYVGLLKAYGKPSRCRKLKDGKLEVVENGETKGEISLEGWVKDYAADVENIYIFGADNTITTIKSGKLESVNKCSQDILYFIGAGSDVYAAIDGLDHSIGLIKDGEIQSKIDLEGIIEKMTTDGKDLYVLSTEHTLVKSYGDNLITTARENKKIFKISGGRTISKYAMSVDNFSIWSLWAFDGELYSTFFDTFNITKGIIATINKGKIELRVNVGREISGLSSDGRKLYVLVNKDINSREADKASILSVELEKLCKMHIEDNISKRIGNIHAYHDGMLERLKHSTQQ